MSQLQNSDEIDLMELLARGYASFKRNIFLFILIPLAGAGIALGFSYTSKEKFSSSMMVETELLTPNEAKFIVEELKKTDSIPGLKRYTSELLGLRFQVEDNETSGGKEVYLRITATVTTPAIFPSLEEVLIRYLNDTRPVRRNRTVREAFLKSMITEIDEEIAAMDKIKQQTDTRTMSNYVAPADLYAKTVEIYEQRNEFEMELKEIQSVHIVKGFQSLVKDARMSKAMLAIIGFIIGFLVVVVIMFVRYFNNFYKSRKQAGAL